MSRDALVAVAEFSTARGPALLVAFRIADHTNRYGWAWPSIALLVDETGYSKDTVIRAEKELEDLEELFIERARNRGGNRYRLRLPGIPGSAASEAADLAIAAPGTVAPVDRSPERNSRKSGPEQSQKVAGTVAPVDRNRINQWNPSPVATRSGSRPGSCDTCGGSLWVDAPGRPGDVIPCPKVHR